MPENINVISRKFYNQIDNGPDFTSNTGTFTTFLKGNSGARYKAVHDIGVSWYATAYQVGTTIINGFTFTSGADTISRQSGSWVDDGFKLGDTIQVVSTGATNDGSYTVSNVTDLVLTCSGAGFTNQTDGDTIVVGTTTLNDVEFQYGLIENSETINFDSKIDGNTQKYRLQGVSATPTAADAIGIQRSWINGSCEISNGAGNPVNITNGALSYSATQSSFLIEHEFILLPTYLDGEISNVNNVNPPSLWESDKCLKYVFAINMAATLSNPNSFHYGEDQLLLGNTGWINETYNGGLPNFSLNSITYEDTASNPMTGIKTSGTTTVTVVVDTDLTINTNTKFVLTHFLLPDQDQYKGTTAQSNTMEENFIYEEYVGQFGAAPSGGLILRDVTATVLSPSQGQIVFDVQYATAASLNQIRLGNSLFLGLLIQDDTTANTQMMLKLGSDEMVLGANGEDVDGLITFNNWELYQHPEDDDVPADGATDVLGYVEDKLLSSFDFEMDFSQTINKVTCRLVAYNPTDDLFFDIQKEEYDFSIYPISYNSTYSQNIQNINLNTTRGFKLASGSDFNKVICSPSSVTVKQTTYQFKWAFAFDWADYKALSDANNSFYDSAELNNGLNQNSSHYSDNAGNPNWGVYLFFDFDLDTQYGITTYRQISPELKVLFYDTYLGSNPWTVVKQLTNQSGVDTSNSILDQEDTKIKFAFTSSAGDVGIGYQGVIRLEEYQNGGLTNIWEISSWKDRLITNNPLIPLSGDTYARITKSPSNTLTIEAQIDKDLVNLGREYQISARIWTEAAETYVFEDGLNYTFEDTDDYDFNE